MIYVDVPFPRRIALQARFEPEWQTTIARSIGGFELPNIDWEDELLRAEVTLTLRPVSEYVELRSHFSMARGKAKAWPLRDPLDCQATAATGRLINPTTGALPAGNGSFQLSVLYGSGSEAYYSRVTRPVSPITVLRNGSPITPTIDYTTGLVAITGHSGGDTYAWTGEFVKPCRYDVDRLPAVIIDREPGAGELLVSCGPIPIVQVRE